MPREHTVPNRLFYHCELKGSMERACQRPELQISSVAESELIARCCTAQMPGWFIIFSVLKCLMRTYRNGCSDIKGFIQLIHKKDLKPLDKPIFFLLWHIGGTPICMLNITHSYHLGDYMFYWRPYPAQCLVKILEGIVHIWPSLFCFSSIFLPTRSSSYHPICEIFNVSKISFSYQ